MAQAERICSHEGWCLHVAMSCLFQVPTRPVSAASAQSPHPCHSHVFLMPAARGTGGALSGPQQGAPGHRRRQANTAVRCQHGGEPGVQTQVSSKPEAVSGQPALSLPIRELGSLAPSQACLSNGSLATPIAAHAMKRHESCHGIRVPSEQHWDGARGQTSPEHGEQPGQLTPMPGEQARPGRWAAVGYKFCLILCQWSWCFLCPGHLSARIH